MRCKSIPDLPGLDIRRETLNQFSRPGANEQVGHVLVNPTCKETVVDPGYTALNDEILKYCLTYSTLTTCALNPLHNLLEETACIENSFAFYDEEEICKQLYNFFIAMIGNRLNCRLQICLGADLPQNVGTCNEQTQNVDNCRACAEPSHVGKYRAEHSVRGK